MRGLKLNKYSLLTVISLLWGAQFLFNELALRSFLPAAVATARAVVAALTLTLVLPLMRRRKPLVTRRYYVMVFVLGFFEATLPFFLIVWGQQHINSCITAIIMGMIPIITVILARLCLKHERIHLGNLVSIVLGFIGLLVLLVPGLSAVGSIGQHMLGELAVLAGASSFALSLIIVKRMQFKAPMYAARDIFIAASIQMLIACYCLHIPWPSHILVSSVVAILMLGVFCAGIVYTLYIILISLAGPTFASLTNYLVPLVGVFLGVMVLGEHLLWQQVVALLLIILAVAANELKGL